MYLRPRVVSCASRNRRVDFGARVNTAIDVGFAASFVVLRVIMLPLLWVVFIRHAWISEPSTWGSCMLGEPHDRSW